MYEYLQNLFMPKDRNHTLEEIGKKAKIKSKNELIKILQNLELDGKIYLDQKSNKCTIFPSNFFVGRIKRFEENQMIVEIGRKNDIALPIDRLYKPNEKMIVAKSKKNHYHIVKKLITPQEEDSNKTLENKILKIFYPLYSGSTFDELKQRCKDFPHDNLTTVLTELETDGIIYYDKEEEKYYPLLPNLFVALIEINKSGQMYIQRNNRRYYLNDSTEYMPHDKVLIKLTPKEIILIKTLERKKQKIVCEITESGIKALGKPHLKIVLNKEKLKNLNMVIGTQFLAEVNIDSNNTILDLHVIEIIGNKNDFNAELNAIAYNNGFITSYTKEEIEQAESMPTEVYPEDKTNRIDLTDEIIFTIDGEHTKDMDDAIGLKVLENGNYELTVSIADVAHYIKFKSPLWMRAERNTTSLYFIDYVSHMLHPKVSNGICSLTPNVERLAKTFKITLSPSGKVLDFYFFDSVIKSKKKMTYEQVNVLFKDNIIPEGYEDFSDILLKMNKLSQVLSKKRENAGMIEFDNRELRFLIDEFKHIAGIETITQGPAEKLIENFMVLTNECLADYMFNLGVTFIYRNHEVPIEQKVKDTTNLIKSLGYSINKLQNTNDPYLMQKIVKSINKKEEFFILSSILLRSMQKAYYSSENIGHYALASKGYSQTTSPIRRFLDLLIQYILDNLNNFYDPNFDFKKFQNYVDEMCLRASIMERHADKAEYEADQLYMIDYCKERKDDVYTAFVLDIAPNFIKVKTPELIEGIVYLEDLDDGNYIYDPAKKSLQGNNPNDTINIGSKLNIILKDYNRECRIMYFRGSTKSDLSLTRKIS